MSSTADAGLARGTDKPDFKATKARLEKLGLVGESLLRVGTGWFLMSHPTQTVLWLPENGTQNSCNQHHSLFLRNLRKLSLICPLPGHSPPSEIAAIISNLWKKKEGTKFSAHTVIQSCPSLYFLVFSCDSAWESAHPFAWKFTQVDEKQWQEQSPILPADISVGFGGEFTTLLWIYSNVYKSLIFSVFKGGEEAFYLSKIVHFTIGKRKTRENK